MKFLHADSSGLPNKTSLIIEVEGVLQYNIHNR
jgi:hypothetical protein